MIKHQGIVRLDYQIDLQSKHLNLTIQELRLSLLPMHGQNITYPLGSTSYSAAQDDIT